MNSSYADKTVNDNLRYIDWSRVIWSKDMWIANPPHPKTLVSDDFVSLSTSNKLFARKFDEALDAGILDNIDRFLQK